MNFENMGPVYNLWYKVFSLIEWLMPFSWVRRFKTVGKIEHFSDYWVFAHTVLSIFFCYNIFHYRESLLAKILMVYGAIRVLEVITYQLNVLLFHPYKAYIEGKPNYSIQNPYRSVILLLHNFIEIVFWFSMITIVSISSMTSTIAVGEIVQNSFIHIITFSFEMASGESELFKEMASGQLRLFMNIVNAESFVGLFLTVISLAKFIGELPHSDIEFKYNKSSSRKK